MRKNSADSFGNKICSVSLWHEKCAQYRNDMVVLNVSDDVAEAWWTTKVFKPGTAYLSNLHRRLHVAKRQLVFRLVIEAWMYHGTHFSRWSTCPLDYRYLQCFRNSNLFFCGSLHAHLATGLEFSSSVFCHSSLTECAVLFNLSVFIWMVAALSQSLWAQSARCSPLRLLTLSFASPSAATLPSGVFVRHIFDEWTVLSKIQLADNLWKAELLE